MGRANAAAGMLLLLLLLSQPAPAGQDRDAASDIEATIDGTIGVRQATQQQADAWAADRALLVQRQRVALARIAHLTERRHLAAEQSGELEGRVAEFERRLTEAGRLQTGLEDTLGVMFARLEAWVAAGLPFLSAERRLRLDQVREELARPDVPPSEKLGRLLETFQIEARYGGTVEVYRDRVAVGNDSLVVDVLRLGRLSLFWRTPDGARAGEYDRAARAWVDLPRKHHRPIRRAMEMAERRRAIELVALPLGRIRP